MFIIGGFNYPSYSYQLVWKHDHSHTDQPDQHICNQGYLLELLNIPKEYKQINLHGLELTSLQINLDGKMMPGKDRQKVSDDFLFIFGEDLKLSSK